MLGSSGNGQPTSPSSRRKVRARRTSGASSSRSYIEEAKDSNNAESVETSPTKFVKKKRRLNPIAEHTQWRAAQGAGQSFNGAKHILDRCSPCLVRGPWELADDRVISVGELGFHFCSFHSKARIELLLPRCSCWRCSQHGCDGAFRWLFFKVCWK